MSERPRATTDFRRRAGRTRHALALGLVLACAAAPARATVQVPAGFADEVLLQGLDEPNSFAFLPDGRLLITEQRTGKIRMFVNGHLAAGDPVFVVPDVESAAGERGLQGIAIDPQWPARPFVYVYLNRPGSAIRIARYLASDDVDVPNGEHLTLSAQRLIMDDIPDVNDFHNGGGMRFGPDGCLYAALGDDGFDCDAADSTTLRGEILRLKVDALPIFGGPQVRRALITPPDNPFVAVADSNARLVYAFGLRNPWRFQIDPVTGALYDSDVGENHVEEMDEIHRGDFLGWPWREGNLIRLSANCDEPSGAGTKPYVGPIVEVLHTDPVGYALISAGMYRPVPGAPSNWPNTYHPLRGDVFYGQYYEGYLRRLRFDGAGWLPAAPVPGQPNATDWATGLISSVDFLVGPDGSMWWMAQFDSSYSAQTGSLHRIRYVGAPASVAASPSSATTLAASPNPFAATTEVSFSLRAPGAVRLAVYDLAGRRARTLHSGPAPAGTTRVRWDGRDDAGRAVPAGVYFARLERDGVPPMIARVLRVR